MSVTFRTGQQSLLKQGCELGVHGIDAWHSVEKGRNELSSNRSGSRRVATSGIRMHWLLRDARTPSVLEEAGYVYDSTFGYNETVGYRAGTSQVFRPLGAQTLLELPLHIQDGALFYPQRLDLRREKLKSVVDPLIDNRQEVWRRAHGSLARQKPWAGAILGRFLSQAAPDLRSLDGWFGTVRRWSVGSESDVRSVLSRSKPRMALRVLPCATTEKRFRLL